MACGPQQPTAKVRSLRKKLAQIAALEAALHADGDAALSDEQRTKLGRKSEVEAELQRCLEERVPQPPAAERGAQPPDAAAVDHVPQPPAVERKTQPPDVVAVETSAVREEAPPRLPSARWEDDPASIEDVAPAPCANQAPKVSADETEVLEGVQPYSAATQASERMRRLVKATSVLSLEAFGTDVNEGVSRKGKWKLTLLARKTNTEESARSHEDPWSGLLGFLAYKIKPHVQCASIAKLAVVPEKRGRGHGHQLVNWCMPCAGSNLKSFT